MPVKKNQFIPKKSELLNKNFPNKNNSRNNSIFPNVNNFNKSNLDHNRINNIRNKYFDYNNNNNKNIFDIDYININNTQNIISYNNNFKYNDLKYVIKRRQSIKKNNSKIINSNTIENNIYSKYNKLKNNKFNISNSYYDTNDTNPHITYSFHTNSNLKNRLQSAKYFSLKKYEKNKNNNNQFITLNNRPNSSLNPNITYRNKIMVYDIYTNKLLKKQEEINKKHYNEKYKNIGTETIEINNNKSKIIKNNIKNDNKTNNKNVKNKNINNSNSNELNFSLISNKDKNDYSIFLYKFNNKNFIKDFSKKIINNKKNLNNNNHQITSNKFMKEILKNISRKIEYLNQKNEIVYEDKVMNLLENEYKEINKNIDLQMEAYCNIKNFSALVNNEIQNNKNKINYNESYLVPFINNIIAPFYKKQKKLISPFITNSNEENIIQKNCIKNTINNDLEYEQLNEKNSFSIDEIKVENETKKNILTKEKIDTLYNAFKLKSTLILDKEQKNIDDSNLDNFKGDNNSYFDNNDNNDNKNMKKNVPIFGLSYLEKNFKIFEKYLKNKIGIKKTTSHFNFRRNKYYLNKKKIKFNSSYDKFKMNVLHNKIYDIANKLINKNKKSKFDKYKAEILLPFYGNLKISSRDLIKDLFSGKTRNVNYEKNLRNQQEENKKIELINEEKNFNIKLEEEKKLDQNEYSSSIKKDIIEEKPTKITNEKEEKKYLFKKTTKPIKIDTDIDSDSRQTPTTKSTKYSSNKFIKYSYTQNNLTKKKSKLINKKKKEDFEIFEKNEKNSSSENSIILNVNNQQNKNSKILSKSSLNSFNKSDSKNKSNPKINSKNVSFVQNTKNSNKDIKRRKRHSLTERTQKQIDGLKKSENIKDINLNTYKPNLDLYESSDSIDSDDLENLTLNKNKYINNYNKYLKELKELYKDEMDENSDSEEESIKEKKGILKKSNNNVSKNKNKITFKDLKNEENNLKDSPTKNEKNENNDKKSEKKSVPLKLHIKFAYNKSKSQITRDILKSLRGNYNEKNFDNERFDIEEYRIIKNLLKEKRKEKKNIILKKDSVKSEKNENKKEENEINENKEEDFREKYIRAKKQRDSIIKINWEELEKDDDDEDYGFFHKITEKDEENSLNEEEESENKNEDESKEFSGRKKIRIKTFKMKNNKAFDDFLKMIQKLKEYNIEEYMKQIGQKYNDKENPKEFNEQQERINKFRENLINNMDQNEVKRKIRSNHCYAEDYENIIGNKLV